MNEDFMKVVEEHERNWGTKTYTGRPSLLEILSAPVVVFWESIDQPDAPYTITLHTNLKEIEKSLLRMLIMGKREPPKKRIALVFENQERMVVRGIHINFGKANERPQP